MMVAGVVVVANGKIAHGRTTTALAANIAEEDMTAAQRDIVKMRERWNSVRHLSADDAAALEDEDLKAAHTRFFVKYHNDMAKMEEIASKLVVMLEPPKIAKKTKSQRKRDKWAIVQAREQFRAAAKVKLTPNANVVEEAASTK